jgi:3D (Asp-Asp-Asp) domain-containing protein
MLKNRIVCFLSATLLFTFPAEKNIPPFQTTQVVVENNNNGMVLINKYGLLINPAQKQFEKDRKEFEKKKAEEIRQKEIDIQKKNEPQWQEFTLTYYSSMNSENGYGAITSQGKRLSRGGCANNIIPQNTQIYLEGYGTVTVNDKGSNKHFGIDTRLDVFIEREPEESDRQYAKRIEKMGVKHVRGYIVK